MIRLAIQKSGDLITIVESIKRLVLILKMEKISKTSATNFPVEVFFLRNGDIPQYLRGGVVDLAIVGENLLEEKGSDLEIIEKLGFSKCRVSIAFPKEIEFKSISDLNGKRIATSYPNTVKTFLKK